MLFLGSLFAAIVALVAVVGVLTTLPDALRATRALRRSPSEIAKGGEGTIAIRGRVQSENLFPSLVDGEPVAWRRLVVSESVGRRRMTRVDSTATRGPVVVADASGEARVGIAQETRVLSATCRAGRVPATADLPKGILAAIPEGVFAWPRTPKIYQEHRLLPGQEVTVVGEARPGPAGLAVEARLVVVGEARWMRVEEVRFVVLSAAVAVIAGALSIPFFLAFN